jgi:hypothetical protein
VEVLMPEESSVLVQWCSRSPACLDILSQQFNYIRSEWQTPRLEELGSSYLKGAIVERHVRKPQARKFPHP